MKALPLLLFSILFFTTAHAQDTTKVIHPKPSVHQLLRNIIGGPRATDRFRRHQDSLIRPTLPAERYHPVVYADFGVGYAFLGVHGLQGNYSLNYQAGNNLFTFRGLTVASYRPADNPYNKIVIFDYVESNSLAQYALLYGKRIVNRPDQQAFNISAGISDNYREFFYYYYVNKLQQRYNITTQYVGLPFEADYQWFSRRFGVGFGLKLAGDISKYSFASFGVDMSLGYHYKN